VLPKQRPVRLLAILGCSVLALVAPASAVASELIDRDATGVRLAVNRSGQALLTYRAGGTTRRVLAWGAVNAIAPTTSRRQIAFRLDYSGGWGTSRRDVWRGFRNACRPYDGPALAWVVTACTAPDGSYWAVQSWQRMLPNYGLEATPTQAVWELRLSHWNTALPTFTVRQDWAYRRWDNLYGSYSYLGQPMFGFQTDPQGAPLDNYGVLVYVDTLNSAYGSGWKRENAFVTHKPTGIFCYGFFPHGPHPSGMGEAYRATVVGAGVLPDQIWQGTTLGPYDAERDGQANAERKALYQDRLCSYN
jgi:hypothetical protein